jgi:hypothetical protein
MTTTVTVGHRHDEVVGSEVSVAADLSAFGPHPLLTT